MRTSYRPLTVLLACICLTVGLTAVSPTASAQSPAPPLIATEQTEWFDAQRYALDLSAATPVAAAAIAAAEDQDGHHDDSDGHDHEPIAAALRTANSTLIEFDTAESGTSESGNSETGAGGAEPAVAPVSLSIDTHNQWAILALRSRNAGQWGDWIEIEATGDEGPDGDGEGGPARIWPVGPVWLGQDAEAVEIAVTSGAVTTLEVTVRSPRFDEDASVSDTPVAASLLGPLAIDSDAPAPLGAAGEEPTAMAVLANALAPQPTILARNQWSGGREWATQNAGCTAGPLYARNVSAAVVHHTAASTPTTQSGAITQMRSVYEHHTRTNGWCDVAYNFFVDSGGRIWEGRLGGIDRPVIGGHASGFNTGTVGIALLGTFDGASPTNAMMNATQSLIGWKLGLHGVDPAGVTWLRSASNGTKYRLDQWVEVPNVMGHRDVGSTSCPGSLAYTRLPGIRSALASVGQQRSGAPLNFPYWRGAASGPAILTVQGDGGVRPALAGTAPSPMPNAGAGAIAIAGIAAQGQPDRGYVLASNGTLRAFGGAPAISGTPAGTSVVDLAIRAGGSSGWILNRDGVVVPFGGAPALAQPIKPRAGTAVGFSLDLAGNGYIASRDGSIFPVGNAQDFTPVSKSAASIDIAMRPDGRSGWVLDESRRLHPFGGAPQVTLLGANPGTPKAVIADPGGQGGWVLDAEGRLLPFGGAPYPTPISTHVGHPVAQDVAMLGYVERLASASTRKYVTALYTTFIGQSPSVIQLDFWIGRVESVGNSRVAYEMASSDEWAGAVVEDIYRTALGRGPDQAGRTYWVGELRRGMRVQDLGTYFYGSHEYYLAAGSPRAYVTKIYQALLHRSPDAAGLNFWVAEMNRGVPPVVISNEFYASLESRRDRVQRLFQDILGRSTDPSGHQYWANWLLTNDDIALAAELAASTEFYQRATR